MHCDTAGNCPEDQLATEHGATGGSFTAPDHTYPAYIEIRLTVTESSGETETKTRRLDPRVQTLTLNSSPAGLPVSLDGVESTAPVTNQVIVGSSRTISAPAQAVLDNTTQRFSSWLDGQAQTHAVKVPAANVSYTARYAPVVQGSSTLTYAAAADARVEVGHPDSNFGADPQLRTDNGGSEVADTYLRFIVAGLSGKVTSAKLRVRSVTNTGDGPALGGTTNGWTEAGITWTNRPGPTTGVISDVGAIATTRGWNGTLRPSCPRTGTTASTCHRPPPTASPTTRARRRTRP